MASPSRRIRAVGAAIWVGIIYGFLLAPLVVVIGASLNGGEKAFMNFPPTDLSLRWYGRISEELRQALVISVSLGVITAAASCAVGVPAALGIVRGQFPGKSFVAALFRAPLQIPAVVIGVSFLKFYYAIGDAFGFYPMGTLGGLAVAHTFMATPYVIGAVSAVLQRFNPRLEEAAQSLGAGRWRAFRRVTLPLIMPGVFTGGLYAFLVSFGDVPVSLFLGATGFTTFPVEVFNAMEFDFDPSILAIATIIIFASIAMLWAIQRMIGLEALVRSGGG